MIAVEIIQEDIEQGFKGDPEWCPIALSLRRRFPTAKTICVYQYKVWVGVGEYAPSYDMVAYMNWFDQGKRVLPQRVHMERL